ncbi:hypothetical protein HPP92_025809 [Vanilla planifolia]|uniref:Uncharacterized protein n=1 Tax=Vanilla planifolia TaxID=51239 RepID=A0A835PIW5_VANPL|nr:hypothetical protein HPP92_026100 [Vanilla planifolia]KAG0452223.1 hypothetical protein HPP92_025809 [Vanilla planifolia]
MAPQKVVRFILVPRLQPLSGFFRDRIRARAGRFTPKQKEGEYATAGGLHRSPNAATPTKSAERSTKTSDAALVCGSRCGGHELAKAALNANFRRRNWHRACRAADGILELEEWEDLAVGEELVGNGWIIGREAAASGEVEFACRWRGICLLLNVRGDFFPFVFSGEGDPQHLRHYGEKREKQEEGGRRGSEFEGRNRDGNEEDLG